MVHAYWVELMPFYWKARPPSSVALFIGERFLPVIPSSPTSLK